jgi:hypothetical protein
MNDKQIVEKFNDDLPAVSDICVRQYIGQVYIFSTDHQYLTRDNITIEQTVSNGTVSLTPVIEKQIPTATQKRQFMQETVRQKNKAVGIRINKHKYYNNTITVELTPIVVQMY